MTLTWFALIMAVFGTLAIRLAAHLGTRWTVEGGAPLAAAVGTECRHKNPQPFRDRLGLSKGPFAGAGSWR
jgi:hypothetical protein